MIVARASCGAVGGIGTLAIVLVALILLQAAFSCQLFKQNGRLLVRVSSFELPRAFSSSR